MNTFKRSQDRRESPAGSACWRFLGSLVVLTFWLAAPACEYNIFPGYHCDETNNCADLPTTVCEPEYNLCVCPGPDRTFCHAFRECVPISECHPDAGPVCDAGNGDGGVGGSGGSGGSGGAGGSGGQGGAGGAGGG